jgi:hypothetical protein
MTVIDPHDNLAGQRQWLGFGTLQAEVRIRRRKILGGLIHEYEHAARRDIGQP